MQDQAQAQDSAQDAKHLQRCINDLVSVLALPAIWHGNEPSQMVQTLLDVLLRMLSLEFAYARLNDPFNALPVEVLRVAEYSQLDLPPEELRNILGGLFAAEARSFPRVRSRLGVEETSIFPVSLGIQGEIGVLVVGSNRVNFPEKTENLLLSVAANQASIGLQEARFRSQQKRIADELDQRVAQRTAELAAANAELQLQVGLLQHLPVSAWTLQPDGTADFVNQVWLEFSGQSLDYVRSHPQAWMKAVHTEDREKASKAFWDGVRSGQDFAFETRSLRARDGTYRWHLNQAVALRDADGKVLKFVGTTTDIDDQKRAQEELRLIVDTIPALVCTMTAQGDLEYVNRQIVDYCGHTPKDFSEIHPDDRERVLARWQHAAKTGEPPEIEHRLQRFDGVYRWFHVRGLPLRNAEGSVVRWYVLLTDIHDRKLAEEELQARERDTRSLLDNMPGQLARFSPDGVPEMFNRTILEYFDKTAEELSEWRMNDTIHPDDLARTIETFGKGIANGQPFDFEYRLRRFDGVYRWFHIRINPVRTLECQIHHWNSLSTDIEDRKRAEDELRHAQSELARVMQVMTMGQLTASIAHEVNQPLSGIITNAGTCLRMLDANPPNVEGARETARRTIRDGHRASDVITRLRTLYSKKEPTLESMDLNEVAREVTALSSNEIQRNRLTLRQEFADDLPPAFGDRIQLQQVILNLLRNAADAMSTIDDRPRDLLVRTERHEEKQVRLSVKDSGIGFTPQTAHKIFEAFYTTKSDGMGIGLSVSRSIIEAHQGRIWATPNDGPGTTFSFAIPCNPAGLVGMPDHRADPSTEAA